MHSRIPVVLLALPLVAAFGCGQASWDEGRLEDVLAQGTWTVSSYIWADGKNYEEDIADRFRGYQLTFKPDGTLEVAGPINNEGRWNATSDELRIDISQVAGGPFHLLASLWFFHGLDSNQNEIRLTTGEIRDGFTVVKIPMEMSLSRLK